MKQLFKISLPCASIFTSSNIRTNNKHTLFLNNLLSFVHQPHFLSRGSNSGASRSSATTTLFADIINANSKLKSSKNSIPPFLSPSCQNASRPCCQQSTQPRNHFHGAGASSSNLVHKQVDKNKKNRHSSWPPSHQQVKNQVSRHQASHSRSYSKP